MIQLNGLYFGIVIGILSTITIEVISLIGLIIHIVKVGNKYDK
jgi:hypothetical protein